MVLQRRLEYSFDGYQVPVVPRASRSVRGRGPIRKKCDGNQIRAFEILASVAGNILQESESSVQSNATGVKDQNHIFYTNSKGEREDEGRSIKKDPCEGENFDEKSFACVPGFQGHQKSNKLNEFCQAHDNISHKVGSASNTYDHSEVICSAEKLATITRKNHCGYSSSRVVGGPPYFGDFYEGKVGGILESKLEDGPYRSRSGRDQSLTVAGSSEDPMELDREPLALVDSESDVKVTLSRDCVNFVPFPRHCDNMKVVSRDDDENSVGCTQTSTVTKAYRSPPDIQQRRMKKLFPSRHWRKSQKLKDGKKKPIYCNGRNFHIDERPQNIYPFKKRKFFNQSPISASDGGLHHEGVINFPNKRINGDNRSAAFGASSSVASQQVPHESKGCDVKLSIKSFKVPELFIEIPATATVGSLKRTVMEAVTAVLGDGLHVGILLQGKEIRDDNKSLLQTGISQVQKRHSLGFILEPGHTQITPPACTEHPSMVSGGKPRSLSRHLAPLTLQPGASYASPDCQLLNSGGSVERDLNIVPSLADSSTGNAMPETQALVAVPATSMEPLAVVPFDQKSHPEFVRRRIRRPFSVSEVEALVQAVEKLGTGRWRDVKLRAFDSAKHRTYVDLKDKWKTLVHTARISPHQRRGEPVPQELLDRVLAAHAYWSQHQARQQLKTAEALCS
ncbi:hypothetical protein RGQ29_032258 [Quercus rubra]|uniref:Uncharacterized protein n=1 Tax=Quercus rubra TaxID=3512 RepID=A0AAN7DVR0_QUERU|nr:hypothetical protein RGQ29_032258 [Quercus rubra]